MLAGKFCSSHRRVWRRGGRPAVVLQLWVWLSWGNGERATFFTSFVCHWQSLCILDSSCLFRKLTKRSNLNSLFFSLPDICYYKKVCPFNGSTPMIHSNTSDFHFSWNQMPNAVGRFPFLPLSWLELAVAMVTPFVATSIHFAFAIICAHWCADSSQLCLGWKSTIWVTHKAWH